MMKQKARSTRAAGLRRMAWFMGGLGAAIASGPVAHAQEQEASADAPTKASCAQAYESAQESRAAGQLQETQTRLSICARPECPGFVQKDCARWLEEVEQELPSIVVRAEGLDAEAARQVAVTIDGKAIANALGGAPIALDPGRHELVAEIPGQGRVTRVLLAQQGVQNRAVTLEFNPEPATAPAASAEVDASSGSPLRPYAYVAWGVGAVGLGMFAVLGTLGRADERGFKDDCPSATQDPALVQDGVCFKPDADDRKAVYEREFVLADIGLVTGIMGAAAGTVLFILAAADGSGPSTGSGADEAGLRLDFSPTPGGGYASVGGAF